MFALLTTLACPTETPNEGAVGGRDSAETPDSGDSAAEQNAGSLVNPLLLADAVSQSEIAQTIEDLAAFETRYSFTDGDEAAADYLIARFEAYGLTVERVPFVVKGETVAQNLVARITGTKYPDEVAVFSAHYDSTSEMPDTLAPGADDNASGVAAVLEAARILSGYQTERSAWFVLTAAEEQGSLGSAALSDLWEADGTDVIGVIAPDMMGYWPLGNDDAFDILADEASEPLATDMATVADELGVPYKIWIHHDYCQGDDHTSYQDAGFPAISPMDCVEAHNRTGSDETVPNYHQSTDLPATIHLGFTARVTQVTTATFAGWVGVLE